MKKIYAAWIQTVPFKGTVWDYGVEEIYPCDPRCGSYRTGDGPRCQWWRGFKGRTVCCLPVETREDTLYCLFLSKKMAEVHLRRWIKEKGLEPWPSGPGAEWPPYKEDIEKAAAEYWAGMAQALRDWKRMVGEKKEVQNEADNNSN